MANEETTDTQAEVTEANTVVVPVPEPGQNLTVAVEADQIPQIKFDPGTESTQEFVGSDLVFTLDNGAVLTFEDFAASINDGEVTSIMLEDGSIIPIDALIAAWNLEVPETAAGADAAGGGGSRYGDDLGEALGGIDKLGVQDPNPFGGEASEGLDDEQTTEPEPIVNPEQDITISISDSAQFINEEGQESDTFTISLSEEILPGNVVTVKVGFTLDTDTSDSDFTTPPPEASRSAAETPTGVSFDKATGILTFTDEFEGTELSFTVTAQDDDLSESSETLTITLSDATSLIGTATAAASEDVTVIDNDTPTVSVTAIEGSTAEEGNPVTFQVELDKASNESTEVTVNVFTGQNDDAIDGVDYDATGDDPNPADVQTYTVTIPAGDTEATFTVDTYEDAIFEGDETFSAEITGATNNNGAVNFNSTPATGTITDNEGQGTVSIDDVTVTEPDDGGTATATFTVTLTQAADEDVTIDFTTADGTAISGGTGVAETDYDLTSGTVTILAGQTSATIDVTVNGDEVYEGNENYFVNLTDINGPASIADNQGLGTITDNEGQGTVSIDDVTVTEPDDSGTVTAAFTVTLTQVADADVTVHFVTADNTAIADGPGLAQNDYDANSGTVIIPEGQTSATINVTVNGDNYFEGNESYYVNLTSVDGPAGLSTDIEGIGTITDNDTTPEVGTSTAIVSEEGLLPDGIPDTEGSPSDVSDSATFTGNIAVSDADGDSLTVTFEDPPANGEFTSSGLDVSWTGGGTNILTGTAGGNTVATISILNNGDYTVNLEGPIDHPETNVEDVASFDVTVRASDGFQSSTGTLTVRIEDDAPSIGTVPNAVITAESGVTLVADTGFESGADSNGAALTFSAAATSVDAEGFIKSSYEQDGETMSSYLTFDGSKLKYTDGGDGSLIAKTADGTTDVYTISADPATGEYTLEMLETLDELQVFAQFNTNDVSGSNSDFYLIAGMSNTNGSVGVELKASAYNADNDLVETVNTRSDFLGVGQRQDVANDDKGDNDILVLEFAKADSWDISTGEPVNGVFETADLSAINFSTVAFGTGEQLAWTAYLDGNVAGSGTIDGTGSESSVSNLQEYTLGPLEVGSEFDTIEFSATEGSSYKIGGINILVANGTVDQSTGVTLVGTDGDNDATATQTIDLTFSSNETLEGSSGSDAITGGSGDDMITGGLGNDILVGGEGEDTFIFSANAGEGIDTISDFILSKDTLSFTDLLDPEDDGLADDLSAYADTITVAVVGEDLVLTVPDQGGGPAETTVTLAGLGNEYADYNGGTLGEMIDDAVVNVDTYAS
jgi:Ca2+-binding RTX toxin-like protein